MKALGETDALGLTLADGETDGDTLALGLTLAEGETEGETLADGLTEADGLTLGLTLADGLTDAEGETDGLTEADGETDADGETLALGLTDGLTLAEGDSDAPDPLPGRGALPKLFSPSSTASASSPRPLWPFRRAAKARAGGPPSPPRGRPRACASCPDRRRHR